MRVTRSIVLCIMSLASAVVPGCSSDRACTQIGCADAFVIRLTSAEPPTAGRYEFRLVIDGRAVTCSVTLPAASETNACAEGTGVALSVGAANSLGSLRIEGSPTRVDARVTQGDKTVASRAFVPSYRESRPNGADCPPVCRSADDSLELVGG